MPVCGQLASLYGDREIWMWTENLHLPPLGNGLMHLTRFILELFIKQTYIWLIIDKIRCCHKITESQSWRDVGDPLLLLQMKTVSLRTLWVV